MITIPTPIPESSATNDIVRVAVNRGPGVTVARIAQEFGAHVGTLDTWIHGYAMRATKRVSTPA